MKKIIATTLLFSLLASGQGYAENAARDKSSCTINQKSLTTSLSVGDVVVTGDLKVKITEIKHNIGLIVEAKAPGYRSTLELRKDHELTEKICGQEVVFSTNGGWLEIDLF